MLNRRVHPERVHALHHACLQASARIASTRTQQRVNHRSIRVINHRNILRLPVRRSARPPAAPAPSAPATVIAAPCHMLVERSTLRQHQRRRRHIPYRRRAAPPAHPPPHGFTDALRSPAIRVVERLIRIPGNRRTPSARRTAARSPTAALPPAPSRPANTITTTTAHCIIRTRLLARIDRLLLPSRHHLQHRCHRSLRRRHRSILQPRRLHLSRRRRHCTFMRRRRSSFTASSSSATAATACTVCAFAVTCPAARVAVHHRPRQLGRQPPQIRHRRIDRRPSGPLPATSGLVPFTGIAPSIPPTGELSPVAPGACSSINSRLPTARTASHVADHRPPHSRTT